jgi:hypothetical protein
MGSFSGYYKGEKKKASKQVLERKAKKIPTAREVPNVIILGKKKKHF